MQVFAGCFVKAQLFAEAALKSCNSVGSSLHRHGPLENGPHANVL
jgi:hypothetical protein